MLRRFLPALALLASLSACAAEPQAPAAGAAPAAPAPDGEATAATADETVRAALLSLLPGAKITHIVAAPVPGFREVAMEGRILYISDDGRFLMQGALIDIARRDNLTQVSEAGLRKALLDSVGSDRRIVFAAAKPRHTITVFTDIDCGYCRRLHSQVAEYNRLGISIEYLFYPRGGLGSESFEKAVAVWCAPDRRKAMTAAKAGEALPRGNCTNPVTMDYELGRRVGLDGTPAIYTSGGRQIGGYLAPDEMLARLDELAAAPAR